MQVFTCVRVCMCVFPSFSICAPSPLVASSPLVCVIVVRPCSSLLPCCLLCQHKLLTVLYECINRFARNRTLLTSRRDGSIRRFEASFHFTINQQNVAVMNAHHALLRMFLCVVHHFIVVNFCRGNLMPHEDLANCLLLRNAISALYVAVLALPLSCRLSKE